MLVATRNSGKLNDYKKIFENFGISVELVFLEEVKIENKLEESGKTFEENSKNKAEFYGRLSGLPTLSDDSGIEIDYLNGEPGIKSRRWPGHEASDEELISLTLNKMERVPDEKRGAQFRAVISIFFPEGNKIFSFEEVIRGVISHDVSKEIVNGYPYSSVFFLPAERKYFSELKFTPHRKRQ